jgi:receptor family ligand binding protein
LAKTLLPHCRLHQQTSSTSIPSIPRSDSDSFRDTQLDPEKALDAIQDLNARGVKIIIGPQSSAEVAMIKPFADGHNILVIS